MFIAEKANGELPISKAKQALQAAYARLSEPGVWVQHTPQTDNQDCLETAIARQFGWERGTARRIPASQDFSIAHQAAIRAVSKRTPCDRLACWNDQRGRTLAEVLAVLSEAMLLVDLVEAEFQGYPPEPPVFVANYACAKFFTEVLPEPMTIGPAVELQTIFGVGTPLIMAGNDCGNG